MQPPLIIETSRLRLRRPTRDDAGAIFTQYAQDAEVTKYLTWRPHENIERTFAFLRCCILAWEESAAFPGIITQRDEQRLLGMIELRIRGHCADLGYVLARPY